MAEPNRSGAGARPSDHGSPGAAAGSPRPRPRHELTYVGHATTLLDMDGLRVLTDPLLRNRLAHLRRYAPPPLIADLTPDVVLVSHAHRDHLDLPSLRAVAGACPLVGPRGCGRLLRRQGLHEVVEVDVGDRVRFGSLQVVATRAAHDGRRDPLRRPLPALGFLVEGTILAYFSGDTDLFPEMAELRGDLDLALLPVAGWGPRLGPGHLDPRRAARAAELLRPRMAVPIHWGTFGLLWARHSDPAAPAREFERWTAQLAPDVKVNVVAPGAGLEVPPRRPNS
jgi:L-ascorbate metabolism protein UlaG (beta-lactamase superfamily)